MLVLTITEQDNTVLADNEISEHGKCLSVTSVHRAIKQLKLRPYRFQAVHQLQQRDTAARIQYYHHWFRRFVRGVHVQLLGLRCKWNILYISDSPYDLFLVVGVTFTLRTSFLTN
jgi:hypothetical protein